MKRNRFVHRFLRRYHTNVIPSGAFVLEIGCSEGSLLHALKTKTGLGIDLSNEKIEKARCQYPHLSFHCGNAENSLLEGVFDYVVISHLSRLSGAQLTVLGIMGEYLGKMYMEHKQKANYIIATASPGLERKTKTNVSLKKERMPMDCSLNKMRENTLPGPIPGRGRGV